MGEEVKDGRLAAAPFRRTEGKTRISAKHQVTIPMGAFRDAGFEPGDSVTAEAVGPGRVVLTRQDALFDEFSGILNTNGQLRAAVDQLRDEWE